MKTENNIKYIHRQIKVFAVDGIAIVDATCGNGNDTLHLASNYPNSQIYAFDVQPQAIANSKKRCRHLDNIEYILDSHSNIQNYLNEPLALAIFNLGYLPHAKDPLTTKAETTIKAIKQMLPLLITGGAIIITLYRGASNIGETKAVYEYLKTIDKNKFIVSQYDLINLKGNPFNVIIECK